MDQEEIFPLSDTINLASSLDTDLEAHKAMEKGSEQDNIIEQTASIQCDVASQIESETREEGGDYDDINDENVNMQLIDTSKTAGKVQANTKRSNVASKEDLATRPCQFTLSRIKTIMKMDPEVSLASKESVFLVTKATVRSNFSQQLSNLKLIVYKRSYLPTFWQKKHSNSRVTDHARLFKRKTLVIYLKNLAKLATIIFLIQRASSQFRRFFMLSRRSLRLNLTNELYIL